MSWIFLAAITSIFLTYIFQQLLSKKKNLPPGPIGIPILGHFHLLGKNPHHDLRNLAREHGPIMYLRFGSVPTVVVSSPEAAELFLKTHDHVFASKPHHEASHYLSFGQKNIVFGPYSPYWRNMRKLCITELLGNNRIRQFQPMRAAETKLLVDEIRRAAGRQELVDLTMKITSLSADMTCLMVFGKKFNDRDLDERGFKGVMKETMEEAAAFNLGDYFPYLRKLDLQGSARRLKKLSKIFDAFLEKIIDDHVRNTTGNMENPDFVDTLMRILDSGDAGFDFDRRHVKAVLLDMLLAGMDTAAAAIEWTISELISHPQVMNKVHIELEEMVGLHQLVDESHLPSLLYLDHVIKESMRLHPPGPLLLHESMEDVEVNGFHIPRKTRILINIWAVARDPDSWTDPEKFLPERFIDSDIDVRGHDFEVIPFSSGRRGCPAVQLGLTMVKFVVGQLVHCFDWKLPDGQLEGELDMKEHFGLVVTRANHLTAVPTYRLKVL